MKLPNTLMRSCWNSHPAQFIRNLINQFRGHDAIYSKAYYERHVESTTKDSADVIVPTLVRTFRPHAVLDVGCGTGLMLAKFREHGLDRHLGLEYAQAGIDFCRSRGLTVRKFDLETQSRIDEPKFDLTISMEVTEHLPESVADSYVSLLCASADTAVMTAATPGQGARTTSTSNPGPTGSRNSREPASSRTRPHATRSPRNGGKTARSQSDITRTCWYSGELARIDSPGFATGRDDEPRPDLRALNAPRCKRAAGRIKGSRLDQRHAR